jgi:hypothetical protein
VATTLDIAQTPEAAEEVPIWVQREQEAKRRAEGPQDLPFGVYLLFSSMVAIAAVRFADAKSLA